MKARVSFFGLLVLIGALTSTSYAQSCRDLFVPPSTERAGVLEEAAMRKPFGADRDAVMRLVAARGAKSLNELLDRRDNLRFTILNMDAIPKDILETILQLAQQNQAGQSEQAKAGLERLAAAQSMFFVSLGREDFQTLIPLWLQAKNRYDVLAAYAKEAKASSTDLATRIRDLEEVEKAIPLINRRAYRP